ncbi:hypothetical protein [Chitinophaga sp. YIM B06452]|uniref:hypothetical protein n=1 Tax=Chitinophaga sp. YIM B06452 TaxID=3082158 RepID=UPI0031FF4472
MKFSFLTIGLVLLSVMHAYSQSDVPPPVIFAASTPCSQGTRPLPGMDAKEGCGLMKWELALYERTFRLRCTYGMPAQGTKGFAGGGKTIALEGQWDIQKGAASNPQATVYQLHDTQSGKTISLLRLNDQLLHLLDSELHLMTGNGGWSYTLNRITGKSPKQ